MLLPTSRHHNPSPGKAFLVNHIYMDTGKFDGWFFSKTKQSLENFCSFGGLVLDPQSLSSRISCVSRLLETGALDRYLEFDDEEVLLQHVAKLAAEIRANRVRVKCVKNEVVDMGDVVVPNDKQNFNLRVDTCKRVLASDPCSPCVSGIKRFERESSTPDNLDSNGSSDLANKCCEDQCSFYTGDCKLCSYCNNRFIDDVPRRVIVNSEGRIILSCGNAPNSLVSTYLQQFIGLGEPIFSRLALYRRLCGDIAWMIDKGSYKIGRVGCGFSTWEDLEDVVVEFHGTFTVTCDVKKKSLYIYFYSQCGRIEFSYPSIGTVEFDALVVRVADSYKSLKEDIQITTNRWLYASCLNVLNCEETTQIARDRSLEILKSLGVNLLPFATNFKHKQDTTYHLISSKQYFRDSGIDLSADNDMSKVFAAIADAMIHHFSDDE